VNEWADEISARLTDVIAQAELKISRLQTEQSNATSRLTQIDRTVTTLTCPIAQSIAQSESKKRVTDIDGTLAKLANEIAQVESKVARGQTEHANVTGRLTEIDRVLTQLISSGAFRFTCVAFSYPVAGLRFRFLFFFPFLLCQRCEGFFSS